MKPSVIKISCQLLCAILLSSACLQVLASDSQSEVEKKREEIQRAIAKEKQRYTDYKKEQKQALADYVADNWKRFQVYKGRPNPLQPKPKAQPTFQKDQASELTATPAPVTAPVPFVAPEPVQKEQRQVIIDFYGESMSYPAIDKPLRVRGVKPASQEGATQYLQQETGYEKSLVQFFQTSRQRLHLDDWSLYLLVEKTAQSLYPKDVDYQILATWKWLNALTFDARIAETQASLVLLLPIDHQVYGLSYITINKRHYYVQTKGKLGGIYSYQQTIEGQKSLNQLQPSQITWSDNSDALQQRTISFQHRRDDYQIRIDYDQRTVQIMSDYPQLALPYYFSQKLTGLSAVSLVRSLQPLLQGKSKKEQAALILSMIQKGIAYQTDAEQFGAENYLYPVETLAYPFADCEDRSVLYAWLVHTLLDIDFVALKYPNHISVGIDLPGDGDSISYRNKTYLIADPTYIGAPIGKAMKRKVQPSVLFHSG